MMDFLLYILSIHSTRYLDTAAMSYNQSLDLVLFFARLIGVYIGDEMKWISIGV